MQNLQEAVQSDAQPQSSRAYSRGQTAVLLPRMRQEFHAERQPQKAFASPHRRKAFRVQNLQEAVHSEDWPQGPSSYSHGGTAVLLPSLRQKFQIYFQPQKAFASSPHAKGRSNGQWCRKF